MTDIQKYIDSLVRADYQRCKAENKALQYSNISPSDQDVISDYLNKRMKMAEEAMRQLEIG